MELSHLILEVAICLTCLRSQKAKQLMFKCLSIDLTVTWMIDCSIILSALPNMLLKHMRTRFSCHNGTTALHIGVLYHDDGKDLANTMLECILRETNISTNPNLFR